MKHLKTFEQYVAESKLNEDSYSDIEGWISDIIAWFKKKTEKVDKYDKEYKIATKYANKKHAEIGSLGVKDDKIYLTLNSGDNRPKEAVVLDYDGNVVDNDMPREVVGKMKVAEAGVVDYAASDEVNEISGRFKPKKPNWPFMFQIFSREKDSKGEWEKHTISVKKGEDVNDVKAQILKDYPHSKYYYTLYKNVRGGFKNIGTNESFDLTDAELNQIIEEENNTSNMKHLKTFEQFTDENQVNEAADDMITVSRKALIKLRKSIEKEKPYDQLNAYSSGEKSGRLKIIDQLLDGEIK